METVEKTCMHWKASFAKGRGTPSTRSCNTFESHKASRGRFAYLYTYTKGIDGTFDEALFSLVPTDEHLHQQNGTDCKSDPSTSDIEFVEQVTMCRHNLAADKLPFSLGTSTTQRSVFIREGLTQLLKYCTQRLERNTGTDQPQKLFVYSQQANHTSLHRKQAKRQDGKVESAYWLQEQLRTCPASET